MERCKSAPGLMAASQAHPMLPKPLRKYASLPDALLKRIDASLINTATPSQRLRERRAAERAAAAKKQAAAQPPTSLRIAEESVVPGRRRKLTDNNAYSSQPTSPRSMTPSLHRNDSDRKDAGCNSPAMSQIMEEFVNLKENFHGGNTTTTEEVITTPTSISINSFSFNINNNNHHNTNNPNNARSFNNSATFMQNMPAQSNQGFEESIIIRNSSLMDDFRVLNELDRTTITSAQLLESTGSGSVAANSVLIDEIGRLRKYIYYLETENLRLNLKIDRVMTNLSNGNQAIVLNNGMSSRQNNNSSGNFFNNPTTSAALNPFELELSVRKAVPESDSDEYKV
jgi:hypothetical protein